MRLILKNAQIFSAGKLKKQDIAIAKDKIIALEETIAPSDGDAVFDFQHYTIFPGLVDVHVHLREPGFSYKETIKNGTMAAAAGGYTTICTMPNLDPVPDNAAHLDVQTDLIKRDACVHVFPYGAITVAQQGLELAALSEIAPRIIAFSDDGHGVQNNSLMRDAMIQAKNLGKIIVAHCEDNNELNGGYIHEGRYANEHGHRGINSASEWKQVQRDLTLVAETGCSYHVCHVSTKESVELLREAKACGLDVTCETAPHYLLLTENDLQEDGRFKMNPPLRTTEDRQALIDGLLDGTIDMIATDHAPHSAAEKSRGLAGSLMGIVGLETAFPLLYTNLVCTGLITLTKLIELMSTAPGRRFHIGNTIAVGQPADLAVFNLNYVYTINPAKFHSLGHATPFAGWDVKGKCETTIVNGRIVWQDNSTVN